MCWFIRAFRFCFAVFSLLSFQIVSINWMELWFCSGRLSIYMLNFTFYYAFQIIHLPNYFRWLIFKWNETLTESTCISWFGLFNSDSKFQITPNVRVSQVGVCSPSISRFSTKKIRINQADKWWTHQTLFKVIRIDFCDCVAQWKQWSCYWFFFFQKYLVIE